MSREIDVLLIPTGYIIRNVRVCDIDTIFTADAVRAPQKAAADISRPVDGKRKRRSRTPTIDQKERKKRALETQKALKAQKLLSMKRPA